MSGSVLQARVQAILRVDCRPKLGVDGAAEMADVVRGDRHDVARTDCEEGLIRKDNVSVERLVCCGRLNDPKLRDE